VECGLYAIVCVGDNGVDLTGLLGGHKGRLGSGGRKSPSGVRGGAPVGGLVVPQKLKLFVKLHIIFALKYNKQQLLSLSPTS